MKTPFDIILKPVLSEKAYSKFAEGTYTFWVAPDSNKTEIANAIESAFKVKVVRVNIQNTLGKNKRLGKFEGKRPDRKKAIVTVAPGQKIEALEGLI
ncbi:50S ribosomal protein L23 [Meiothermus granaticius]|uniref:Large ribosomal subunit protein uL23 n=1 Tax=Meiothermus granaticius NBRC 107808 TaxID=1227551 RepID=A0A399FCF9_9DEIN|nr:50S ribosomal protein L23 [Meiothermus granaticius]MCL6527399.1 50S ribosomal protein L23 [Thermaceae bacterium]RIH92361.1 50S ribosomal protein L23 [Meiothermus granaticius NBRC 107808]GEM87397.1 50S ribosomal protein L23 [Meiothermus granaticius NBRC 107808]